MRRAPTLLAVIAAFVTIFSAISAARAASNPTIDDELHLQLTFSLWATSIDGSLQVENLKANVDACFSELIHDANYAFNPGAELTKGNWVLSFNMTFSKISSDLKTPIGTDLGVQSTIGSWYVLVGYTVLRHQFDNGMTLALTPGAGVQITYADNKIDPQFIPSQQATDTFFDPVIGGRIVLGLSRQLDWRTEGTIGGFGIGSQLTWSAGSYLDWKFAENFALSAGYRAMAWDYDLSASHVDLILHGPWIGLTWKPF